MLLPLLLLWASRLKQLWFECHCTSKAFKSIQETSEHESIVIVVLDAALLVLLRLNQ